ncbi:hypothetical protein Emtol_0459 [Emticicia oligotrophica DSM 17448]|uniref:DUF4197 domain-containing protein n=1 Tax=Emticicia oligotrophica (strain DSM 17448 / CIP 109782 / MTCC 6937 / GPTSA100-15) TaxID=929562 RepID=A0ABN4AI61_EMTOG|nr:hypothetical protein [Emticicia oligotrophica]AFK01613.1 hypothetical protein Emtol_0459 [Emticicia oligotrophica DSM 17448]
MKKNVLLAISVAMLNVGVMNESVAYHLKVNFIQEETTTPEILLDKALEAEVTGDKNALFSALTASTAAVEKETKGYTGNFKDKLIGQVSALQKLTPLVKSGLLKGDMLKKVVNTVKMLLAAKRIESALGGSSLLGNTSGLTKNLGLMKTGLSVLGTDSQKKLGGFLNTAISGIATLSKGGMTAKVAEPAVRNQLAGILDFVKGAI